MEIIFNKYQFKYLFGKDQPIHKKSLIRPVNEDLKILVSLTKYTLILSLIVFVLTWYQVYLRIQVCKNLHKL